MLSIVIASYNRADRLLFCLSALQFQTCRDFEVLVCDDGGFDETPEIFRRWAQESDVPAYFLWQQKRGFRLAALRNLGTRAARGDAFVVIDSDILLNPNAISEYTRLLRENPNRAIGGYYKYLPGMAITVEAIKEWQALWECRLPPVDIPQHNYQMLNTDVRECHFIHGWSSEDLFRNEYEVWRAPFSLLGGNLMIPRLIWDKVTGWEEALCHYGGEDADMSIQIAQAGFGFSYARSVAGGHMAHSKWTDAEKGTFDSMEFMKKKWPRWFPNGEPLWSQPGWKVP